MSVINIFRAKSRPQDRFEILVRPHIESLYRFAYRLTRNQHDAEELVQKLLTKLYPKINQLEGIEKLKPWLSRAMYNLYVDGFRKQQTEASVISPEPIDDETAVTNDSPDHHTSNELTLQQLNEAIQQLNKDQQIVIMLHDAEGYTLSELEDILQTPVGTLKSRLHRARNILKAAISMEPFIEESRVKAYRSQT